MSINIRNPKLKQRVLSCVWNQIKNRLIWCCESTNLHGFHYLANKNTSAFAQLCFALISCCSFILCTYLILLQLYEYKDQFIITRILSTAYPVWKFRFPSVTVCNFNVVYKDNLKNLMDIVTSHGIKEETVNDFVHNLSSLTLQKSYFGNTDNVEKVHDVLERSGYNVDQMMAELAQPCNSMVKKCFWRAAEIPCSQIIQRVKTNHGYCCSFNYYGTNKTADGIADPQNLNYTYMGLVGSTYGLRLVLDVEENQYVSFIKPAYGFSVLVQEGADYPNMYLSTNTLLPAEEMKISVKPSIYVSSKNIKNIRLEQRKCFFEDEGNLEWSSIYSYKTCISECRAKATFKFCNCTPFYYPFENFTRICTLADVSCLHMNGRKYDALHLTKSFITDNNDEHKYYKKDEEYIQCRCHPQCNERIFNVQANKAKVSLMAEYEPSNWSILNVYYSGDNCIKSQRDVYYTWDRILAAVGGIFSLCLGGSVISIIECFYIFGKCVSNYSRVTPDEEKIPEIPEICRNISVTRHCGYNFKQKPLVCARAHILGKGFGNQ